VATRSSLPAPIDAVVRQKARDLFFSGESNCCEIARQLSLSENTVRGWCAREKWRAQLKIAENRPTLPVEKREELAKSEGPLFEPTNLDLAEKQEHYTQSTTDAACRLADHLATLNGAEIVKSADKILKADQIARKALRLETDRPAVLIDLKILSAPVRPSKKDDGRLRSTRAPVQLIENE
jgi:Putative ATPase subunit of terminase (gpP-like)